MGDISGETYPALRLRSGREYSVLTGHPWLFSGAFANLPADIPAGAVVDVVSSQGQWVARGHLNARNSLAFRVLTLNQDERIDDAFYVRRIERALKLRRLLPEDITAYRLVHAEADYLPGLIVDRYDRWLVAQFHTAGVERQRAEITAALQQVLAPEGMLARDDIRVREREGLAAGEASLLAGSMPETIEVSEGAVRYLVDPWHGQKTGFFLDQRDKRATIGELARRATSLLNCFSYSGGFALADLVHNPSLRTVNVDASTAALELAKRNYALNGHEIGAAGEAGETDQHQFVVGDVNRYLQSAAQAGKTFDVVILDPPAFAKNLGMKERALRGYETLNTHGARVVAPDGLLLTCSCSGGVDLAEFENAVRQGLRIAHRSAQLIASFGPSLDHPSLPGFPEDRYLKALLFRLD
jgi:23S rRNA (cytosine1962-C5)-methyltransferase